MSSSVAESTNPVSKAISDAAATNPSTQQTRFSFYDAHEVELQISSSENKEGGSETMKDRNNPENSNAIGNFNFSNTNATGNNHQNTNNNKHSSRKELATVDSNAIGLDGQVSSSLATSTNINNMTINTNMPTVDAQATEDILRSLQETEEQRMQLLGAGGVAMPATVGATTGGTRALVSSGVAGIDIRKQEFDPQEIISVDQSFNDSNSNPYEDAIKEALDLLRRHRSPAASPAFVNKVAESFANDDNAYPPTVASAEAGGTRPAATGASATTAIPTTREELTDAYEEARLKAKQRQERMAKYASRLQEFKSGMTTTPTSKATPTNINNISNTTAWQASRSTEEEENGDHVIIHTTTNNRGYSDTIRQVGTNDDSVGFSDLSQSTKQREEEVQRGVEKVLLAILEKANSSRGRAVQNQHDEHNISNYAPQSSLQSHYSQDSMGDTLIRAMDELLLGPQPQTGPQQLQPPQSHHHYTINNPLKNASSRDSGMDSVNTGTLSKNSKSVVDELLAEEDDNVVSVPSALDMTSPTSTGPALMGESWGDTTEDQHQQHQHREEKKLPDSMEKEDDPLNTTLNAVMLQRTDEEQSDFHDHADVEDLVDGFLSSEKDLSVDSGEDAIIVIDDDENDQADVDEHDRYAELAGDDDDDQIDDRESGARVLGPLSKAGGSTGVVLDIEEVAEDEESDIRHYQQKDDPNEDCGPFSHVEDAVAPEQSEAQKRSAIEQQETHHREAEKQSHDAKHSSSEESEDEKDSDDDDDSTNDATSKDTESKELMRTLCAHLLPFGVDQSNSLLDAIPDWDEENPNEAGYRIIRLSRAQLRSVEYAFETMIKATSERRLNGIDPNAEGNDANFVKELQVAEKLLDDEERRVAENKLSSTSSVSSKINNAPLVPGALQIDGENDDKESTVDGSSSALCHPDFPGIRPTGKGEMGDLEYFHLPIIFKSHVTGFEPTKDLVLEPGNVVASQYLVESELGSAAFSTAYRCVDLSSDGEDVSRKLLVC